MAITKKQFKEFARQWVILELIIAGLIAVHLGVEGLAFKFCSYLHVQTCDEVEWSDEYESKRSW